MQITHEPKYNIGYIKLKKRRTKVECIQISDDLVIDVLPDGSVYGIELLNAKVQLGAGKKKLLALINRLNSKRFMPA